jgi:hypothetical protein
MNGLPKYVEIDDVFSDYLLFLPYSCIVHMDILNVGVLTSDEWLDCLS